MQIRTEEITQKKRGYENTLINIHENLANVEASGESKIQDAEPDYMYSIVFILAHNLHMTNHKKKFIIYY